MESMEPCRFSDFKTAALHHLGNPMGGGPITYCDVRIQSQGSKHIRIFLPAEKPDCICTSVIVTSVVSLYLFCIYRFVYLPQNNFSENKKLLIFLCLLDRIFKNSFAPLNNKVI